MDDRHQTLRLARHVLAQRLISLEQAGVEQLGRVPPAVAAIDCAPAAAATTTPAERTPLPLLPAETQLPRAKSTALTPAMHSLIGRPYPQDLPQAAAERQQLLDELNAQVRPCLLCRELASGRKQTVFGVGNPRPRVAFFGEAPGADEDRQGEPFVGRAGQLLTKIIEACGWQRSDVYIMNVLKCRPPDNRNPLPPEVDNCRPFFERQLEILRPEYIVCVGSIPSQALLETTESVGKLRGRLHRYRDSQVLVTYHPSYLLRNPAAKKYVWEDMQFLLKAMGLPIPKKQ
jgi:DNA polymerase